MHEAHLTRTDSVAMLTICERPGGVQPMVYLLHSCAG
jgi:hypothetical protein